MCTPAVDMVNKVGRLFGEGFPLSAVQMQW
jgi:hypothetical protein